MRDILLALALTWCVWLTWDIHHNYKQDKRSIVVDKLTFKILKIHTARIDKIYEKLGIKDKPGEFDNM